MSLNYRQQNIIKKLTLGLSIKGPGFTFRDIIYNFKQSVRSFRMFFKVIWNFRGFDYHYTLEVFSVCLKMQLESIREETALKEIDETRVPKEEKIERCLQLLNHIKNDDYLERCGYDYNYEVYFKPIPGSENSTMESTETQEQKKHNNIVREKASEKEDSEWNELWDTLKLEFRSFWS
ncbi:MAG: hypothetical protein K9H26_18655 [Prolixibacteraceae bacterium]|nr:hypothetical protein [Prolixibacteraceae bacterium]